MNKRAVPFWKHTPLEEMSREQWESLCDGCGRCCLVKIPGPRGADVPTSAACRQYDGQTGRCKSYATRTRRVADCVQLTPELAATLPWLPPTCAYRLLAHGEDLPGWHPLVTGDPDSVERAGMSMRGRVVNERFVHADDLVRMKIRW
jgi:uncharacterized cysteine cluster protein YcgN (CxxCxxCC family)